MESKPNTIPAAAVPAHAIVVREEKKPPQAQTKKKRGAMNFLRATLLLIRRGSGKTSKPSVQIEVAATGVLNKVVGSMRPLHMQSHQSPPHEGTAPALVHALSSPGEHFVDVLPASPMSTPARPYSPSRSSTSGSTSRYASAVNLQDLVQGNSDDDEDDEDGAYDVNGGDDKIDAKAEEFILQFYRQMRAQTYSEKTRRRSKHHAP